MDVSVADLFILMGVVGFVNCEFWTSGHLLFAESFP